jgi:hypothetical protein
MHVKSTLADSACLFVGEACKNAHYQEIKGISSAKPARTLTNQEIKGISSSPSNHSNVVLELYLEMSALKIREGTA